MFTQMPWKTKFRKSLASRHLVKEEREDIIILIDLELLSPYTSVTQVAKVQSVQGSVQCKAYDVV